MNQCRALQVALSGGYPLGVVRDGLSATGHDALGHDHIKRPGHGLATITDRHVHGHQFGVSVKGDLGRGEAHAQAVLVETRLERAPDIGVGSEQAQIGLALLDHRQGFPADRVDFFG